MSNLEILQKLTMGKDAIEDCIIEVEGEETTVQLRPLTSGELSRLQSIEKKGFVMKVGVNPQGKRQTVTTNTDVDVNAGDFNSYQNEAMFKAVSWSMSIGKDKVTVEDVQGFAPGIPEQLFEHVIRISHLNDNDLTIIKNFRKNE